MFNNSQNFNLDARGASFTVANSGQTGKDLLKDHIAPSAFHNSNERYDAPTCHPRTREAVINSIIAWIEDGRKTSFVMWLYGPAGGGKSSIAQTIANMLQSKTLVASFFWSRSASTRNSAERLIASLAYQLLVAIPRMEVHVEEEIRNDPALLSRSMEAQMEALIITPLRKAFPTQTTSEAPRLIILDGLDECGNPAAQSYILKIISTCVRKFHIPIIFLIASRPEPEIRNSFNAQPLQSITTRLTLDDKYNPSDDIRLYLFERFASLKESHMLGSMLPQTWPSTAEVNAIVAKSSGQFIYAATVIKFVGSGNRRPDDQLRIIMDLDVPGNDQPFAELDALYHYIFSSVKDKPRAFDILNIHLFGQFSGVHRPRTAKFYETILDYKRGEFYLILNDLHSVLDVPSVSDQDGELRVFHASLQDFLTDTNRSKNLYVEKTKCHARLTRIFLKYISRFYEVDDPRPVESMFLGYHCSNSFPTLELLADLFEFDLEKWVFIMYTNSRTVVSRYKEVVDLTTWFQKQESLVAEHFGAGKSLYQHHSRSQTAMINSIGTEIVQESKDITGGKHTITAFTHPRFASDGMEFGAVFASLSLMDLDFLDSHTLIPNENKQPSKEQILELQKFVRDPDRAGECFVDGRMYSDFSLEIAKIVFDMKKTEDQPSHNLHQGAIPFCVQTLPFFLSNADYTSELSEYLLSHRLGAEISHPLNIDIQPLRDAIALYLKKQPELVIDNIGQKQQPNSRVDNIGQKQQTNSRVDNKFVTLFKKLTCQSAQAAD